MLLAGAAERARRVVRHEDLAVAVAHGLQADPGGAVGVQPGVRDAEGDRFGRGGTHHEQARERAQRARLAQASQHRLDLTPGEVRAGGHAQQVVERRRGPAVVGEDGAHGGCAGEQVVKGHGTSPPVLRFPQRAGLAAGAHHRVAPAYVAAMSSSRVRRLTAMSASAGLLLTLTAIGPPAGAADPAPVITALSVTSGPTGGGTKVIIRGSGFGNQSATVNFGGPAAAKVEQRLDNLIVATTAAHAAGDVWVRVTDHGVVSPITSATRYRYATTDQTNPVTPSAPTGARVQYRSGTLEVGWNPAPDKDVTGHSVYAKYYGDTAWTRVATNAVGNFGIVDYGDYAEYREGHSTSVPAYTGERYQIAVTAVDSFGHESLKSAVVNGAAAPTEFAYFNRDAGGFNTVYEPYYYATVGGGVVIDRNVTWSRSIAKRFVIGGPIIIKPGATLTIAGGTVIKLESSGYSEGYPDSPVGSVLVAANGGLVVQGTSTKPVTFTKTADATAGPAYDDETFPGAQDHNWYGIVTTTGARVTISNTEIRYSDHGLSWCKVLGDGFQPCKG